MLYRRNEVTLKDALKQMIQAYRLKDKIVETRLVAGWEQLMGKTIARHTLDVYVKNHTLFIRLDSAPIRSEMHYSRERIMEMVNDFAGEAMVKEVVIK